MLITLCACVCVYTKSNTRLLILTTTKLRLVERDFRNFFIAAHYYVIAKYSAHKNAKVMNNSSLFCSALLCFQLFGLRRKSSVVLLRNNDLGACLRNRKSMLSMSFIVT